ncbi:MAG TPA: flagellar export chaperone FlgN [Spirochaetia bacterium]|nr:flagellar export chaperone FlgN [Spirochaetia bacterium]
MASDGKLTGDLREKMKEEIHLFHRMVSLEEELNSRVKMRDWLHLEGTLDTMKKLTARIEEQEEMRNEAYHRLKEELGLDREDSFAAVLAKTSGEERRSLSSLHNEIKCCLFTVKGLSNGLVYYFASMYESIDQVLSEIFPHRKGKIYSKKGDNIKNNEDPIVINQTL